MSNIESSNAYVVVDESGTKYLTGRHTGGAWWTPSFTEANVFTGSAVDVEYLTNNIDFQKHSVRELFMGSAMSPASLASLANAELRRRAMSKLSKAERNALNIPV